MRGGGADAGGAQGDGAGSARLAGRKPVARLAAADVAGSFSRTGVAIAALGMALTAMIGVAVMVESFRDSLGEWLTQTLRADVYVTAPGPTDELARRLEPQVVRALLAVPACARTARRGASWSARTRPLDLNALRLAAGASGIPLHAGDAAHTVAGVARGALLISEPLAWRLGFHSAGRSPSPPRADRTPSRSRGSTASTATIAARC